MLSRIEVNIVEPVFDNKKNNHVKKKFEHSTAQHYPSLSFFLLLPCTHAAMMIDDGVVVLYIVVFFKEEEERQRRRAYDGGQITEDNGPWTLRLDNTGHYGPMGSTMEGTNQIPLRWPYHWERHAAIGGNCLPGTPGLLHLRATNDCVKRQRTCATALP